MSPGRRWVWLQASWRPRHVAPPGAGGDLVVTDALQIRRLLNELAGLRRAVDIRAADGRHVGSGVLTIDGIHGVIVPLQAVLPSRSGPFKQSGLSPAEAPPERPPATTPQWPLNATASGPQGMLLFTLTRGEISAAGVLRATWFEQLIRVQSRRHFRLPLLGAGRRVRLVWPASGDRVAVRDLSEAGACLERARSDWSSPLPAGSAELHLDDQIVAVSKVEAVHERLGMVGAPVAVGVRLLGIDEAQVRTLRRWMAAAQTGMAGDG